MDENIRLKNTPPLQEPIFLKTDTPTPSLQEPIFLDRESVQKEHQCVICLENISEKNSCTTECSHRFCCDCLLRSAQTNTNCPLCRHQLIPPPPTNEITQEDLDDAHEEGFDEGFDESFRVGSEEWELKYTDSQREVNKLHEKYTDSQREVNKIHEKYISVFEENTSLLEENAVLLEKLKKTKIARPIKFQTVTKFSICPKTGAIMEATCRRPTSYQA